MEQLQQNHNIFELWFVRHGQTYDNLSGTMAGDDGGKLTGLGIKQAQLLGQRLNTINFKQAYVSNLNRTKQTFLNINSKNQNCMQKKAIYTNLLREKWAGTAKGMKIKDFQKMGREQKIDQREWKFKEGESWNDVYDRIHTFLQQVINQNLKQNLKSLKQQSKEEDQTQYSVQDDEQIIDIKITDSTINSKYENQESSKQNNDNIIQNIQINENIQNDDKNNQINSLQELTIENIETQMNKIQQTPQKIQESNNSLYSETNITIFKDYDERRQSDVKNNEQFMFDPNKVSEYDKYLCVCHGGVIQEVYNVINFYKYKKQPVITNDAKNCSIHAFRVFCTNTGTICSPDTCKIDDMSCIEFKCIIKNDNTHLLQDQKNIFKNLNIAKNVSKIKKPYIKI